MDEKKLNVASTVPVGAISQPMTNRQHDALAKMREKFPDGEVGYRPMPLVKKDEYDKLPKDKCKICGGYHATSKTGHLSYVGHAAITNRLLDCDPLWELVPLALDADGLPKFDATGGLWAKLTVAGVTRLCYGHAEPMPYSEKGAREKAVYGDALRNGCMRFGAALEMWHKGTLGEPDPGFEYGPVEPVGKAAIVMPVASVAPVTIASLRTAEAAGNVDNPAYHPADNNTQAAGVVDAELLGVSKQYASDQQLSAPGTAPEKALDVMLAEEGEVAFISKKLSTLKSTNVSQLLLETIGKDTLDDLSKEQFALLKNAVKGKK